MFIDIPANMLGCFVMGLLVSGDATLPGVEVDMPVACLPQSHAFQSWSATHLGLRTGLFGSLTTFASWNTQMVVMICAGKGTVLGTQWVSALFGYVIGWMAVVQSFVCGRDVAVALHRWNNPDLRRQADAALEDCKSILEQRDVLDDYSADDDNDDDHNDDIEESKQDEGIHHLQQANDDTDNQNRIRKHQFLRKIREIQRMILVRNEKPRTYLMESARNAGWDVNRLPHLKEKFYTMELGINSVALACATALLIWGAIAFSGSDPPSITYRTYFIATLFSPFGTILRWQLSRLNGSIQNSKWEWFPVGTFLANMIASSISALMAAISLKVDSQLASVFVAAIKFGFAGCLSTVSTFVVEVVGLMKALPQHAYGYYYSLLSLGLAAILARYCLLCMGCRMK